LPLKDLPRIGMAEPFTKKFILLEQPKKIAQANTEVKSD